MDRLGNVEEERSLNRDCIRAPNKMNLHSNRLFCLWTASYCIDHPRMACFAFLARNKNAGSRCDDHFVRGSKYPQGL
jgi:hypothetical protein